MIFKNESILTHINESSKAIMADRKEYSLNGNIQIYIKDPLDQNINLPDVMKKLESTIPAHLISEIDSIFVGVFEDFEDRDINAMYKDGAIYVSNDQDDSADMLDDIVHEIAHSLETPYGGIIYGDKKVEREFFSKRMKLYQILKSENLNPDKRVFIDLDFSTKMDDFLYHNVGYDRLSFIVSSYGLFVSAYAPTSLQEYFANGFEHFFLDDRQNLYECCPELYKKIEELYDV
tara:strand:- start:3290 stop:3988 length:699 start_codon:yes stop_codon:yes gene_type:complete